MCVFCSLSFKPLQNISSLLKSDDFLQKLSLFLNRFQNLHIPPISTKVPKQKESQSNFLTYRQRRKWKRYANWRSNDVEQDVRIYLPNAHSKYATLACYLDSNDHMFTFAIPEECWQSSKEGWKRDWLGCMGKYQPGFDLELSWHGLLRSFIFGRML